MQDILHIIACVFLNLISVIIFLFYVKHGLPFKRLWSVYLLFSGFLMVSLKEQQIFKMYIYVTL